MRITRLSTLHAPHGLLFVISLIICGLSGSDFLVWVLPHRETAIYFAATLAFVGGLAVWRLGRRSPRICRMLFVTSLLMTAGFTFGHRWVFITHARMEFPSLYEHLDLGEEQENTVTSSRQKKLVAVVRNSQGFRSRLFVCLKNRVNSTTILTKADSILASRHQFLAYEPAQLPHDLSWTEDPYDDRSWNWHLHNMDYVVTLARAYEKTGHTIYLQRAEDLILDWISDNTRYILSPPSEFSWDDHSTAIRLLNWLYFFDIWKSSELATPQKMETILRSLVGHAQLLSDGGLYTQNHNHGIDQDMALLAFSLMQPKINESRKWRELALSRLLKQIHFVVSPRGIHLEHSPGYHLYGMRQLQKILSFLELWEVQHEVIHAMRKNIALMAKYVPHLVRPDGYLVQIGDTRSSSITKYITLLAPLAGDSPVLRELIETGSTQYLSNIDRAFREEGYAVIRDFEEGRQDFRNSFYLFFTAGAHEGHGHRQADDLSFVLSYGGRQIIVDPGVYSYKHDAGREYVISAAAHNTVVLDGTSYKGWDTSLDFFVAKERYTLIRASHRNYPGFEHSRWLLYIRPTLMFVIDRIQPLKNPAAPKSHHFEQMFHFSPDLHVEIDAVGSSAEVFADRSDSRCILRLTQLGDLKPAIRVAKGEQSPLQGWYSPAHAKLVPAPTLIMSLDEKSAEYITALELTGYGQASQKSKNVKRHFQAATEAEIVSIRWAEGETIHNLSLNLNTNNVSLD